MQSTRLEAFSDGVFAIIITIMVLELNVPEGDSLHDLWETTGLGLLTYLLSFVYVGIYWSNHHHLLNVVDHVDGMVLWANLHLLLWLSLYPFTTAWMNDTDLARTPTVVYGVNLLGAATAYSILVLTIERLPAGTGCVKRWVGTSRGYFPWAVPAGHRLGLRRTVARRAAVRGGGRDVADT